MKTLKVGTKVEVIRDRKSGGLHEPAVCHFFDRGTVGTITELSSVHGATRYIVYAEAEGHDQIVKPEDIRPLQRSLVGRVLSWFGL